jgi:transcription factor WhiB
LESDSPITLADLGIDAERFTWQDLAACKNMDVNLFFDRYEKEPRVAKQVDQICLHCPVIEECFNDGQYREEMGVRAGFYLVRGEVDEARNKHKDRATVLALTKRIFSDE